MLREQAHEWAQDHGGRSLRAIATERRRLLQSAKRYPDDPAFALALARLVDLEGSRDDVRAALELARNHAGDPVTGARLALALAQQGFEAGDLGLASRETLRALDLLATPPPHALAHAEVLTSAILARARLAQIERREAESDGLLAEARTLIDRWSEDGRPQWPWLEAIGAALESGARLAKGQRLEARSALERALRAAVSYGGDLEVAMLCGLLGNLAHEAGDLEGAIGFYRSAVRHARAVQSIATEAVFLGYRGWAHHERGDERAARRAYRAAITHAEALPVLGRAGVLAALLSSGCYANAGSSSGFATIFDPADESRTVVGRDCSFHLGGMAWRDLAVRRAARKAVEGTPDAVALAHVTSRLVYPAPFKVCIEVEGIPLSREALAARSGGETLARTLLELPRTTLPPASADRMGQPSSREQPRSARELARAVP